MKVFKSRLILGVIVTSFFISSCSGTDELVIRERNLQKAIENKVENCESLYALYSFTSYADIEIFTGDEADENYSKRANLFKKYALEVLEISQLRNHFNKTEYIKELASVTQNVDGTDLPDNTLDRMGQRYFPDCDYFQTAEVLNDPLEQENASENTISSDSNKNSDVILKAPSLVFWGIPFRITANSSDRDFEYCIFKFGGSNSMYAETLGKVFASNGVAEITHTLVWNGGLGSTAWSKYWAVCSVDGREFEIDSVDVQGAR